MFYDKRVDLTGIDGLKRVEWNHVRTKSVCCVHARHCTRLIDDIETHVFVNGYQCFRHRLYTFLKCILYLLYSIYTDFQVAMQFESWI